MPRRYPAGKIYSHSIPNNSKSLALIHHVLGAIYNNGERDIGVDDTELEETCDTSRTVLQSCG
jgi:hypothetical protein